MKVARDWSNKGHPDLVYFFKRECTVFSCIFEGKVITGVTTKSFWKALLKVFKGKIQSSKHVFGKHVFEQKPKFPSHALSVIEWYQSCSC